MAVCDVSGSVAPKPAKFLTRPARPDNDTNLPLAGAARSADRLSCALANNSTPGSCLCTTGGPACNLRYLPFFRRHPVASPEAGAWHASPCQGIHILACMMTRLFQCRPLLKVWTERIVMFLKGGVFGLVIWLKAFWLKGNASLCVTFCVCFGVRLSWRKLQLGACVVWIGWELNFHAGAFSVPQDKRDRLAILIETMLHQRSKVDRRDLHKVTGMIQWLLQAFPMARAWIGALYRDLRCPPATLHSLDPAYFADLHSCLDDGMLFVKVPSGTAIPIGSRLLEARRVPMTRRRDLHKVVLSGKRVWLRVADPAAPKRKLSDCSIAFLKFWQRWCKTPGILRALEAPRRATLVAAADAMGQGDRFAIGGFLRFSSCVIWFSESFAVQDFAFSGLTLSDSASDDISCYECLAQIALLHCACAVTSSGRLCVRVPSWTDNTGAESVANRLYTSKYPLCMLQWNWTPRIFLAPEMNWRIGFPAGMGRTTGWFESCFSDSLGPSSTVASYQVSGPVSGA